MDIGIIQAQHRAAFLRPRPTAAALRVRVPRDRPGVRPPKPRIDWTTLWALASLRSAPAAAEHEELPV